LIYPPALRFQLQPQSVANSALEQAANEVFGRFLSWDVNGGEKMYRRGGAKMYQSAGLRLSA
jgi:hypothetical protein